MLVLFHNEKGDTKFEKENKNPNNSIINNIYNTIRNTKDTKFHIKKDI